MKRAIVIAGIAVAVVVAGVLSAPLFYDVEVDEPLPVLAGEGMTLEEFSNMADEERQMLVTRMSDGEKDAIMDEAAGMGVEVSEGMDEMAGGSDGSLMVVGSGEFEGLYGHRASGTAKIISVGDQTYLRFEDFSVTNGPDLKVYLTPTGDISDGHLLADLKGSRGDQNYLLGEGDIEEAGYVVIYCQPFHVYFARAPLA